MQNRYVGDIGDFVKLGILRALGSAGRLGVAWWLHPDEGHNADGRHTTYLGREAWRRLDPPLFDALKAIVEAEQRNVAALQGADLLPGALYAIEPIPTEGPALARRRAREAWFEGLTSQLATCDLVFVDPDNGLETSRFSPAARRCAKCVSLAELIALATPGRTLLVYHHQTRRVGGHEAELAHWGARLQSAGFTLVDAIRAPRYSPRAFFLLNAPEPMRDRARALCDAWDGVLEWRPDPHHGGGPTPWRAA
jgi:hypothetical protein